MRVRTIIHNLEELRNSTETWFIGVTDKIDSGLYNHFQYAEAEGLDSSIRTLVGIELVSAAIVLFPSGRIPMNARRYVRWGKRGVIVFAAANLPLLAAIVTERLLRWQSQ